MTRHMKKLSGILVVSMIALSTFAAAPASAGTSPTITFNDPEIKAKLESGERTVSLYTEPSSSIKRQITEQGPRLSPV